MYTTAKKMLCIHGLRHVGRLHDRTSCIRNTVMTDRRVKSLESTRSRRHWQKHWAIGSVCRLRAVYIPSTGPPSCLRRCRLRRFASCRAKDRQQASVV